MWRGVAVRQQRLKCPLHPASAVALLATDWLLYLVDAIIGFDPVARTLLWGCLFGGVVVWLVESVSSPWSAHRSVAKGLLVGLVLAAPGLWLGTTLSLLMLAWSAI